VSRVLAALAIVLLSCGALAREAAPLAEDPQVEARLGTIAEELRCLVCQNESLIASRADLAMDLKRQVREQIKAGKSDAEIRDYMVQRYGDFVLYRPPVKGTTLLLWFGPLLLLAAGFMALWIFVRRRRTAQAADPLGGGGITRRRAAGTCRWFQPLTAPTSPRFSICAASPASSSAAERLPRARWKPCCVPAYG
jgi:cytochrome c-type biogenesis protein CcmH